MKMISYLKVAKELLSHFDEMKIKQVPREENTHTDALVNLGSSVQTENSRIILLMFLKWPAKWKTGDQEVFEITHEVTWITPLFDYIHNGSFPDDCNEARKIKAKAARFTIIEGWLFKRSYSGPYLTCVNPNKFKKIIAEHHEGKCRIHSGERSLAHKELIVGYYWPTM